MRLWAFLAAICALGCGVDAPPEPDIEGFWVFEPTMKECGFVLLFDDGVYEADTICRLNSGEIAVEAEVGSYSKDGRSITFSPTHSSCGDADGYAFSVDYDFVGDKLRLVTSGRVIVLESFDPEATASGGSSTYGCFDEEGLFTPMPVRPI